MNSTPNPDISAPNELIEATTRQNKENITFLCSIDFEGILLGLFANVIYFMLTHSICVLNKTNFDVEFHFITQGRCAIYEKHPVSPKIAIRARFHSRINENIWNEYFIQ